jgi:hypothetical protein
MHGTVIEKEVFGFIKHHCTLALDSVQHKPSLWLRYFDDRFVVWPRGPEKLQDFLSHLNSLRPSIQFTMEIESDSAFAFLIFWSSGKRGH